MAALGDSLVSTGVTLREANGIKGDRSSVGSADRTAGALEEVVGGWRRERLVLAKALVDLGLLARKAGGAYVETEAGNAGRFLGGGVTR